MCIKPKIFNTLFLLFNVFILVLSTLIAPSVIAETNEIHKTESLPELIIPVDKETARKLITNMHIIDKESLFFTKRYRIVKINTEILDGKTNRFTITPFRGKSTTLEMTEFITEYPGGYKWKGEVSFGKPINEILELKEEHRKILRQVSEVNILIMPILYNAFAGSDPIGSDAITSSNPTTESLLGPVQVVNLRYTSVFNNRIIRISNLTSDPNYHLIVEEDTSKQLSADSDDPESINRRENFQVHRAILKSNPKMMIDQEKWEQ